VGNSELHIAHVLWGGLLLFAASLLPLVIANRWVYKVSALLADVGFGLLIDEVGKFITQSNNYFYPAAAPIIYAFFLLTVLLYLQVRRSRSRDARVELYHALDKFEEVLDHDLDARERAGLDARLYRVNRQATDPDTADWLASCENSSPPMLSISLPIRPVVGNGGCGGYERMDLAGSPPVA
jgi:hypothetical protein